MEGVTFKIASLFTALKSHKEMDKTLRSSHAPSVIMFCQCPISGSLYFYTASEMGPSFRCERIR